MKLYVTLVKFKQTSYFIKYGCCLQSNKTFIALIKSSKLVDKVKPKPNCHEVELIVCLFCFTYPLQAPRGIARRVH